MPNPDPRLANRKDPCGLPLLSRPNACFALACLGLILLAGVPITKKLSALVARRAGTLQSRGGAGDAYTYFFGDRELEGRLRDALYLPESRGVAPSARTVQRRIQALGPEIVPVILGVLCGERALVALPAGEQERRAAPGVAHAPGAQDAPEPGTDRDVVLLEALWNFDPVSVLERLDPWVAREASVSRRVVASRALAGLDDPHAIGVLLRILNETPAVHFERPYVRTHFEEALERALRLHPEGLAVLRRDLEQLDSAALPLVVNSIPVDTSGEGLALILALLDREPELDAAVLQRISKVASSVYDVGLDDTLWRIHWLVNNPDWSLRRQAAVALGNLGDPNSCPQLIVMLGDADRRVARGALWSLRQLSGRNFAADQDLWSGWYEEERAWFEGPAVELEAGLRSEESSEVVHAIGQMCHRPLFKNHMAEALGPLLWHQDLTLVPVVCAALAQLDSGRAVPFLVERLTDVDDAATEVVRQTLTGLTGVELPPGQDSWALALGL